MTNVITVYAADEQQHRVHVKLCCTGLQQPTCICIVLYALQTLMNFDTLSVETLPLCELAPLIHRPWFVVAACPKRMHSRARIWQLHPLLHDLSSATWAAAVAVDVSYTVLFLCIG
jgi:hypothetical protein